MKDKIVLIGLILFHNIIFSKAQNPCFGVFTGTIPHPDLARCNAYYVCIFFIGRLTHCANNEIFDSELKTCVSGDPSTCSILSASTSSIVTNTPTLYESTTTQNLMKSTTEINLAHVCEGIFFGARPHPSSNALFIGCIRGEGMIMSCLNDEIFDPNLLKCVSICKVPEDICEGIQLDVIINPCHCYRFIVCYVGIISVERDCEENYIFDANIRECRYGNRQTCDFPEITESTTTPTTSTPSGNLCEGILLGNQPMPNSCTMFYRCINQIPQPQQCPAGTIFSRESLQCVEGDESECVFP